MDYLNTIKIEFIFKFLIDYLFINSQFILFILDFMAKKSNLLINIYTILKEKWENHISR